VPYDLTPKGWAPCDGSLLSIDKNAALYTLLGTQFGGNGTTTFGLPDTRGHEPAEGLKYLISLEGAYPRRATPREDERPQTDVYAGELLLLPYFTPAGWLPCNGQLLPIEKSISRGDHILYTLFGTKFGGDKTRFALPDMRERAPVDFLHYAIALPGLFPPRFGK